MLAALKHLEHFTPIAIAPETGPLADALREKQIAHLPFTVHAAAGNISRDEVGSQLAEIIKRVQPNLLHANSLSLARLTGAFKEQLSLPCTGHLRDIIKLSKAAIADLNRNDGLIAVSAATRDFHVQQGLESERVAAIHNGVDLQAFCPQPKTGFLHKELGLPGDAKLIGTIGQICLRKGQDLLPKMASRLRCPEQQIHFVLVGERYSMKQESQQLDESITQGFAEYGLSDHFHRLGFRQDSAAILRELDLLLHPARQEPLGRVLLEAAASGCPIVATDVGGTREIVDHEQSALLFPVDDAERAAEQVERILASPDLAGRLTRAARERSERHFDITAATRNLEQFWKSALS